MMHYYALRSESLFMTVEVNPRLTREQIDNLVREHIDLIDDRNQDYLASITHGQAMAPDQEPANQALITYGKTKVLRDILATNDIDTITDSVVATILNDGDYDEISARKLARKLVERVLDVEENHRLTLERMAKARPVPSRGESDVRITHVVDLDLSPAEAERIARAGRSAKIGTICPDHQMLTRLVDEKIAAGEYLTGEQWADAKRTERREDNFVSPHPTSIASRPSLPRVSEIWDDFIDQMVKTNKWRHEQGVQAKSTLSLLLSICGDRPLDDYTLQDGSRLRSVVLDLPSLYSKSPRWAADYKKGDFEAIAKAAKKLKSDGEESFETISPKTWNRHHSVLASLWLQARHNGWMSKNDFAFEGLFIDTKKGKLQLRRKAKARGFFNNEHLKIIFSAPLFLGSHGEDDWKTAGTNVYCNERYWAVLIAAFTGMRLGEIPQLRVRHVKYSDEIRSYYFDLTIDDDWLDLKDIGSPRIVPVHSDLLKLGLIEMCVRGRNPKSLLISSEPAAATIAAQRVQAKKMGIAIGKFFGRFKTHLGLGPKLTFHSFRHTMLTNLKRAGVPQSFISEIVGHEDDERPEVSSLYDHGLTLSELHPAIERLVLPIDIDRLLLAQSRNRAG